MRIKGNAVPEPIHLEACAGCDGMVELRLRENAVRSEEDGIYCYDEYVIRLADRPGLYEEVANDLGLWLATARTMEGGQTTSYGQMLRDGLEAIVPGAGNGQAMEMVQRFNEEMKGALQIIYDALNQGQQQKLMKQAAVKDLFHRYGVGDAL